MIRNIIRRLMLLVSLIVFFTSSVGTTYGFVVTRTDSIVNIFTPFERAVNKLIITKAVEHPYGDEYVIPDTVAFDFRIDLGAAYANTTVSTGSGEIVTDANGSAVVSIKPFAPLSLYGLDAGTTVTVTDLQKEGSGFFAKDGVAVQTAVVTSDGNVNLDFVNVYSPAAVVPDNVGVVGRKILSGREWQSGDVFTFVLEQNVGGEWITLGTRSTVYDPSNPDFDKFDFTDIISCLSFDAPGVYSFRMTEQNDGLDGIDYDESVNTFDISVTDFDMDGKLEINTVKGSQNVTASQSNGAYSLSVVFNNTFVPAVVDPDTIEVAVTVNKTVKNTGSGSIGPEGFEFILENTASGEKLAMNTNSAGKAVFKLPFTADDAGKIFSYKLYETDGGKAGVTYDKDVYDITVTVSLDGDGNPTAQVSVNGMPTLDASFGFENVYNGSAPVKPSPSTPPGGAPQTGDARFAFWIAMMIISASACILLTAADRRSRAKIR